MGNRRGFSLLALAPLITLAGACMWDMDTLAEEAKGKMDLVGTIVGRFDRNPPRYYEMRIERVTKEIASHPSDLNLYDDLGVAEERLGHHNEAITWMAKKKAAMKPLDKKSQASKDAWYRYHANLGTFYAHRALDVPGYRPEDFDDAQDHIRKAIQINPDAHFGREMIQLDILNWMSDVETNKFESSLGEYLWTVHEKEHRWIGHEAELKDKIVEGLSGLIRLGSAWQSVDVFAALRDTLSMHRDGNLASLADFRVKELFASGKHSHLGDGDYGPMYWQPMKDGQKFNEGEYKRLREEAEQHQKAREAYMLARFEKGKHPDTDPHFWDEYREGAAPEVRSPGFFSRPGARIWADLALPVGLICCGLPVLTVVTILWLRARKRASRGS